MPVDRWALLYLTEFGSDDFRNLESSLSQVGFGLVNPVTGAITAFRDLGEAERLAGQVAGVQEVSRDWVLSRLAERKHLGLDMWMKRGWDLLLSVSYLDGGVEVAFDLHSVARTEYEAPMLEMLLTMFKAALREGIALGMSVDPEGYFEEFDWQGFFLGKKRLRGDPPRILALPASKLGQGPTKPGKATKEIVKDFVIFRREYGPAMQPEAS